MAAAAVAVPASLAAPALTWPRVFSTPLSCARGIASTGNGTRLAWKYASANGGKRQPALHGCPIPPALYGCPIPPKARAPWVSNSTGPETSPQLHGCPIPPAPLVLHDPRSMGVQFSPRHMGVQFRRPRSPHFRACAPWVSNSASPTTRATWGPALHGCPIPSTPSARTSSHLMGVQRPLIARVSNSAGLKLTRATMGVQFDPRHMGVQFRALWVSNSATTASAPWVSNSVSPQPALPGGVQFRRPRLIAPASWVSNSAPASWVSNSAPASWVSNSVDSDPELMGVQFDPRHMGVNWVSMTRALWVSNSPAGVPRHMGVQLRWSHEDPRSIACASWVSNSAGPAAPASWVSNSVGPTRALSRSTGVRFSPRHMGVEFRRQAQLSRRSRGARAGPWRKCRCGTPLR